MRQIRITVAPSKVQTDQTIFQVIGDNAEVICAGWTIIDPDTLYRRIVDSIDNMMTVATIPDGTLIIESETGVLYRATEL